MCSIRKLNVVHRYMGRSLTGDNLRRNLFYDWCNKAHSLYKKDLLAHYGCVNAVEFAEDGSFFVSGSDDRRVILWPISEAVQDKVPNNPTPMVAEHGSNVFCLAVSLDNLRIFSGGNDLQTIIHDSVAGTPVDYFLHEKPVYGISLQPCNQSVFATACDDGKLRIFDLRSSSTTAESVLASKRSPFHSIMFHPIENRIVASASAKDGPELWDLRSPLTCLQKFPCDKGATSVRFNTSGNQLLCLSRREPPTIHDLHRTCPIELQAENYSNACTMKSCCFAGEGDEYAVSGSDDQNIYIWKIPKTGLDDAKYTLQRAHLVLKGHRSVVNHVRYNGPTCLLASCGVEKMVKIWSVVALPKSTGGLDQASAEEQKPRRLTRLQRDCNMIIAPSTNFRSTEEDKKMLAFFDMLVERSTWMSSGDEDSEDDDDDVEVDDEEYSNSDLSSSDISSDAGEESFEIDSISTPSSSTSSASSSDDDGEPVPGPSGLNPSVKLELPAEFHARRRMLATCRRPMYSSSSSSDDEDAARIKSEIQQRRLERFRSMSLPTTRQFRKRRNSSSSSSS